MISRDSRCVFVADNFGLAEVIVLWLGEQGIAAQAMNKSTLGDLDGLSWLSRSGMGAKGMEIWVNDLTCDERARKLLYEHVQTLAASKNARAVIQGDVEVACEKCGATSTVAASAAGKIMTCENCGAYIDVPDESAYEEDWFDEEFEAEN